MGQAPCAPGDVVLGEGAEPCAASGTSAAVCAAAALFFCWVGSFFAAVDGTRCVKHSVNVCKELLSLPGTCTSRLFAFVM